jgi:hypothetical protein
MKKLILAAVICTVSLVSNAQKVSFGIIAGANLNSLKLEVPDARVYGAGAGFHGGVIARIQCSPGFAIQPQVELSQRRSKWYTSEEITTNMTGIDVPVNFLYTEKNFFVGGGPSFRYGLTAKHSSGSINVKPYENDAMEGFGMKRFELGASMVAGYKLKSGLFFSASYNPSFTDLGEDIDLKNHTTAISVGFLF